MLQNEDKGERGSKLRSLLGLDQEPDRSDPSTGPEKDDDSFFQHDKDSQDTLNNMDGINHDENGDDDLDKEIKFIPGIRTLEEKIRSTINERKALGGRNLDDLTPWEKYQLKRKEKKREKKLKAKELRESFKGESRDKELKKVKGDVDAPSSIIHVKPSSVAELDLLLAGDDGMFISFYSYTIKVFVFVFLRYTNMKSYFTIFLFQHCRLFR